MQTHKEPFSQTGVGPIVAGLIIAAVIVLAGIWQIVKFLYGLIT